MLRLVITTLLLTAVLQTEVGATQASNSTPDTTATLTKLNELNRDLKKIDKTIQAVNIFIVSLNSYLTAFNNIIK